MVNSGILMETIRIYVMASIVLFFLAGNAFITDESAHAL